jgi:hypothetical protein
MTKILQMLLNYVVRFSKKFNNIIILKHNNINIEDYPENNWYFIPYPQQKGFPFNSDNLTTVNRRSFLYESSFQNAKNIAEDRWGDISNKRDISWRLHVFLWTISQSLLNSDTDKHIFIECGTGKGYMAAATTNYFNWGEKMPIFFLIDSFKSTQPNAKGEQNDNGEKLFVYADDEIEVRNYFSKYSNIEIITGVIPHCLNQLPLNKKVKFFHLDLNFYKAEEEALEFLKIYLEKGCIILFDDFGGPGGELQAQVHEKFAKNNSKDLLQLPTGQALLIW